MNIVGKRLNKEGANLMKPIRILTTGALSGPDITTILEVFGKSKTLERLKNGIK